MSRVIITGATGQDASLLAKLLVDKGDEVVSIMRRSASPNLWRLEELGLVNSSGESLHRSFQIIPGDITDASCVDYIVKRHQPDKFFNLAAMSFVHESWNSPQATINTNVIGVLNCLEAVSKFQPECKFYQASSSEQVGTENNQQVFNEETRFYPRSPYGVSKAAAHYLTVNYRESYGLWACCGLLGNHESIFRGEEFVTRKISKSVAEIKLGIRKKITLGNIFSKRDWGAASDFVKAMDLMLEQDQPDDFVIATGQVHSVEDFVRSAILAAGLEDKKNFDINKYVEVDKKFLRPADVNFLMGDATKAMNKLGWRSKTTFNSLVKQMVEADLKRLLK